MAEPTSDPPGERGKYANLPPPPDDVPDSVAVPRMEPPPSSLGAMVRPRAAPQPVATREVNPWLILFLLVVAGVATTIYLYR